VKYEEDKKSKDAILRFLRERSVKIRLAGRIESLDKLARDFVANVNDRAGILKKAEALEVEEKRKATKKIYVSIMQKIMNDGDSYISSERKRLNKLLKDKDIKLEKKGQTEKRANILQAFADSAVDTK
jgi:protein disulfide-isomerase A6